MNDISIISRLWSDLKPHRALGILGIALYAPITILNVLQPVIIGLSVQSVLDKSSISIWIWFLAYLLNVVLFAFLELIQGITLQTVGQRFVRDLRQKAFIKSQRLSMGYLDKTPMGKALTVITNDSESVAEMFSLGAVQIFGDMFFMITTLLILFVVNKNLSLYSSAILPILALGIFLFRFFTRRAFVGVRRALSHMNEFLQEHLSGLATIQIFDQLKYSHERFKSQNEMFLEANRQAIFLEALIYSFVDAMSYISSAVVLYGGMQLSLKNMLALGALVSFIEALNRFYQPVRELSNRFAIFQSALVSLNRLYKLINLPDEEDRLSGLKKYSFDDAINFKNVWFSYNIVPVLKDVSFRITKGERVALVGRTGSGKSTVIKLINRFYNVSRGSITIDNINIDDLALDALRGLIMIVPQEVFLFRGTLRENLAYGKPYASDEELWKALSLVGLDSFVRLGGGLLQPVISRGQNFSLGQRQLLALARIFIMDPPILILDEATASVDMNTEKMLEQATIELLRERTAIIIAHRLSTISYCDRIMVFDQGKIVESGTEAELIAKNGYYASLKLHAFKNL